jgi:hypothetical protein
MRRSRRGKHENFAVDSGSRPSEKTRIGPMSVCEIHQSLQAAADRSRTCQDFAGMHRLAHHVVDAAIEKRQRRFQTTADR